MSITKHAPYYYWRRMVAEFKGAKGCNVGYGIDSELSLTYHETKVAAWNTKDGTITLDHGGWLTYFTKERINRFLDVLDVGCKVYQAQKVWRVFTPDSGEVTWCSLEEPEPEQFILDTLLICP